MQPCRTAQRTNDQSTGLNGGSLAFFINFSVNLGSKAAVVIKDDGSDDFYECFLGSVLYANQAYRRGCCASFGICCILLAHILKW
jgi:hypothetical protein